MPLSDSELCGICSNPARDESILCVVEQPADMVSIEKTGTFSGRYHILSGVLSPMNGVGPDDIRIKELKAKAGSGSKRNYTGNGNKCRRGGNGILYCGIVE